MQPATRQQTAAIAAIHWNHGDAINGIYVTQRADRPGEFTSEIRPATIVGFSSPMPVVSRNWGWMGDALVQFADGTKSWQSLAPKAKG